VRKSTVQCGKAGAKPGQWEGDAVPHSAQRRITMAKKAPKVQVTPSADTNATIREKCARTVVDTKAVQAHFGCSYKNALILSAAAENNLVPAKR
jgi:hypothetical protein